MKKCIECGVKLEPGEFFDDPQLCDDHWHLWWYIGMFMNEDGTLIDYSKHKKMYPSLPKAQEQELHYYNRIKSGERFKNWKKGNEVEND
jgi:hypothetical protein